MSKMIRRKVIGSIVVCLVAVMAAGGVMPPAAQGSPGQSVSIDPASQTRSPGGTFSVDILVNSNSELLKACHVEVGYDPAVFTASAPVAQDLLGTANILEEPGWGVTDGLVTYGVTRTTGNTPVPVSGVLISIEFEIDPAATADIYTLDVKNVILKDENNDNIPGVGEIDGEVVIEVGRKGDFDGDGDIDFDDFILFADAYDSIAGDDNYDATGDFDEDGDIDFDDFILFADAYGT